LCRFGNRDTIVIGGVNALANLHFRFGDESFGILLPVELPDVTSAIGVGIVGVPRLAWLTF
jgi:hypothetical protein